MDEIESEATPVTVDDQGPKDIPESDPLLEKLVKHCFDLFDTFSQSEYRKEKIKEIEEARRVYEQKEDKEANLPFEDSSNITLPLTTITIDQTEPRFTAALVGKEPYVTFEMEALEKKPEGVDVIQDFYNKELKHTVQLVDTTIGISHDLLIDGTIFVAPKYSVDEQTVRDFQFNQDGSVAMEMKKALEPVVDTNTGQPLINPMTGEPVMRPVQRSTGRPLMQEYMETIRDGGELVRIPFNDMYYPDNVGTVEEWDACDKIRRIYPTYSELWALKDNPGYKNIGPWLLKQTEGKTISDAEKKQPGQHTETVVTGKETVPCIECHISYPIYHEEEKEKDEQTDYREEKIIITIAEKSRTPIYMRLQREIYWQNKTSVKRMRLFPEHGRSCGTGFYGKLKSIQQGASDMFNAIIDIAYICMLPWFFYEDKAGLQGEVKLQAGMGVKVDSVQGILIPQFTINPNQYVQFVQTFMGLWERLGSIGDWQIGRTNEEGGKRTATEVMTVIQEGNIRQNYQATITRREYTEMLTMLYDLYYQFMPLDKTFKYKGKDILIPRQSLKRNFKFVLSGSSETANKMIARKEAEDMLTLFGQDPMMNQMQLREDVLQAYGKNNPEDYIDQGLNQIIAAIKTDPVLSQSIVSYLQQKAAAGNVGTQTGNTQPGV